MEAKATAKYVRVSARKAGQICDLVRGKDVNEALAILKFTPRYAAEVIAKVVKSAAANAENNHEMDTDKLYIASIVANQGPTMKRFMPRAQSNCNQKENISHRGSCQGKRKLIRRRDTNGSEGKSTRLKSWCN